MTHDYRFSQPFDTLEAAQQAAPRNFFDIAGICTTSDGKYAYTRLRPGFYNWTSEELYRLKSGLPLESGYTLIMLSDPIILCWCGIDGKALPS